MGSHDLANNYVRIPSTVDRRGTDYPLPEFAAADPKLLAGIRVAIVSADCPELPEIDVPLQRLRSLGAEVKIVGQDWIFQYRTPPGIIVIGEWLSSDLGLQADLSISQARQEHFDVLIIPGGAWNPDMLRSDEVALAFVRDCYARGILIASLCHGPQVLINADCFPKGTHLTGTGSIRKDLRNAGFVVHDSDPVVYDRTSRLITSRDPNDLKPFCDEIVTRLLAPTERNSTKTGGTDTIEVGDKVYVPESVTLPGGLAEGDALEVLSIGRTVRFRVLGAHWPSRKGSEYEVETGIVFRLVRQHVLTVA